MKTFLIALLGASLFLLPSVRADQDPTFAKANQEYAAGHFREAIENYDALVREGRWSANLFYDLGNAWFRLGDFGRAILNYERALALEPHHPEADANLQLVRDEARALELKRRAPDRYLGFATSNQFTITAAAAFWFALFVFAGLCFSRRRTRLVALLVCGLVVLCGSAFAVYLTESGPKGKTLAIIIEKNIQARVAVADNSNSVLALPPGSEIKILSTRGDWIYAALPNDLRGWIPAKSAEAVRL